MLNQEHLTSKNTMDTKLGSLRECSAYEGLLQNIEKKETTRISGIKGSADSFFAYSLSSDTKRPLALIYPDNDSALRVYYDLSAFFPDGVLLFPAIEELEGVVLPASMELKEERLTALKVMLRGEFKVAIFTDESFSKAVIKRSEFEKAVFELKKGKDARLVDLVEALIGSGYHMEPFVEKKGDISVRGGILDIYLLTEDTPVRVDFFGDTVDSIRTFDLLSQKSSQEIKEIVIYPAGEEGFKKGKCRDYLPQDTVIYIEESIQEGAPLLETDGFTVVLNTRAEAKRIFNVKSVPAFGGLPKNALAEIRKLEREGKTVSILFNSKGEQDRLAEILAEEKEGIAASFLTGTLAAGFIFSFELGTGGICFITDNEIFGRYGSTGPVPKKRRGKKFFKDGAPLNNVFEINNGEIVVHENYGVARFLGLKGVASASTGGKKDFLTLEYQNGDKLYVPVEDINKIQKYIGFEEKPPLSNLGTSQWEKAKEKVREDVKKMADDLLNLYAARENLKGHAFSLDTEWQKEFEEAFIYEETADQLKAVSEVKKDMEKGKPVDRLVCGDVGFGKTEVAIRAAFKCATDGKQVAFVCPTTILAEQHYNTFKERMADYPVRISMLSRFGKKSEHTKTLSNMKSGGVDIVIGTHRLLQEDIVFKDLGMLILDDEQKFGVAQKERLKKIKNSVYSLSLSATPIPRTLYLSLSGIREISNINTPPAGRLAIQTYIIEHNEKIVKGAIERELKRGGEVYYVYNKVKTIERAAEKLRRLVPDAKIAVAHGQLPGPELEKIMYDFYKKKYNVLVCSTIIEAGLDNPSANTIIVEEADDLGLSQMYQLRGRVGRSRVQAYAYFTYPKTRALTETAEKRLTAIEECDELSMGYSIAMKDLQIRGAGNILGKEQHGQISRVGLELFMKLLREAVNNAKGIPSEVMESNIEIDLSVDAFLPEDYVKDSFLKINLYKDMMAAAEPADVEKIKDELVDRFGKLPLPAFNLLKVVKLRIAAGKAGIKSIDEAGGLIHFTMKNGGSASFRASPAAKLDDILGYFSKLAT